MKYCCFKCTLCDCWCSKSFTSCRNASVMSMNKNVDSDCCHLSGEFFFLCSRSWAFHKFDYIWFFLQLHLQTSECFLLSCKNDSSFSHNNNVKGTGNFMYFYKFCFFPNETKGQFICHGKVWQCKVWQCYKITLNSLKSTPFQIVARGPKAPTPPPCFTKDIRLFQQIILWNY